MSTHYRTLAKSKQWVSLSTASTSTINLTITTNNGSDYFVQWGDGNIGVYSSGSTATHTYSTPYAGDVKFKAKSSRIDSIQSTAGAWNFDLEDLGSQLPNMTGSVIFNGDILMAISGDISNIPQGLTGSLMIAGSNITISGDISNLPQGLTGSLMLSGNMITISGDISNLPQGLSGQIYIVGSAITISGDISNIPQGLSESVRIAGSNITISGDISSVPQGLNGSVIFEGNMITITGDISNLPQGLTGQVYINGNMMTISGDISSVPIGITILRFSGTSMEFTYTSGRIWLNMSNFYIRVKTGGFVSSYVDNVLIDLNNSPLMIGSGTIDLRGNCGAPTSVSATAITSLASKGKTVLTN